ncbi:MAG: 4-carboxymuconolactone decarboxylase, partial [Pseudomonadota bacterium]
MSDNERHEKGMALRAELLGPKFVERMNQNTFQDPIMQKFRDVAAESVFGSLWTRSGLDLKTRTLV